MLWAWIPFWQYHITLAINCNRLMALYATNGEDIVFAADAILGVSYKCLECRAPVKPRRGKDRIPHFYHLQTASRCYLHSKSENHLLLQLQLQKRFFPETIEIEHPFFSIHRIADLVWFKEKIIFEIQCSTLDLSEAKQRVIDYGRAGYEVVWLLDDRIFNKRFVRPAEEFYRSCCCYFFSFVRSGFSLIYDQMEIIINRKRCKKGCPLIVDLQHIHRTPSLEWPSDLPEQIARRTTALERYFRGDIVHKAIQAAIFPSIALALRSWKQQEIEWRQAKRTPGILHLFLKRYVIRPYLQGLHWVLEKIS